MSSQSSNREGEADERMDNESIEAIYAEHGDALKRFLLGVLRDENATADVFQRTLEKLMLKGHKVDAGSIRSWLFRVGFNEAMGVKRKQSTRTRVFEKVAWTMRVRQEDKRLAAATDDAIRTEDVTRVKQALLKLSDDQRAVVVARIYDGVKFKDISEQLNVPLGTVLTRMRSGLKKLGEILGED